MGFETFIFDIDGTLTDSGTAALKAFQMLLLEELGREYSLKDLEFILGLPITELGKHFNIPNWSELMGKSKSYYDRFAGEISFFPDMEAVVRKLSGQGAALGIVTSKTRAQYESGFAGLPLASLFSCVICADDTNYHKPHPYPLQLCIHRLSAFPQTSLYIGDSENDMLCAKSAGVSAALALWGNRSPLEYSGVIKLQSPLELLKLEK